MKYLKSVMLYYFKNFPFLMVFSILPIVFVGLLLKPFQFVEFLFNYPSLELDGFGSYFYGILPFDWLTILLSIVGLVIVSIFISMLLGKIEIHFRVGKKKYNFDGSSFNNNIASVFLCLVIVCIAYIFIALISASLLLLIGFIFSSMTVKLILTWIIGLMALFLVVRLLFFFGVVCADMMIMGSSFPTAMSNASRAINKHGLESCIVCVIPLVVGVILTILGSLIGLTLLTNVLALAFIIPFMSVAIMTVFFDYYDIPRYDSRPYYNLK